MRDGGPRIALVTTHSYQGVDEDVDMPLLSEEMRHHAYEVHVAAWDDPSIDWSGFDLAIVRSTWDYSWRLREFLTWASRCACVSRLENSVALLRWNADKRYLEDLASRSVPVVPTSYLAPGDRIVLPGNYEYVVKPAVGAGSQLAARYVPSDKTAAESHIRDLHMRNLTALVQPYIHEIDSTGERALVFLRGVFLHAVRKQAVLTPNGKYDDHSREAHPGVEPWAPSAHEIATAEKALSAVPDAEVPLYARVDLIDGPDKTPLVAELELVEPNLFLKIHPSSVPVVAATFLKAALG
ncbi:hypothetical protein I6A60_00685 [Frankia sp. AgB1.9]|uniref:ATP-grasp domain-containing protein n=1 Tax=unclassified Frankia TaxID=2632575 RepID=UPI001931336E|nr:MULTISPECIES: hypothetical protein [unclassified Frankia]MBL7494205.1 hypothetical protein [Frankia sp. AgW1.1]MBL7546404.1 hypothetical protein [Frankia sp. AgB1.9]MBL7623432.1 hypothetical protein [Frankia sp. AgB1.8]